jgi:hypothetical protein
MLQGRRRKGSGKSNGRKYEIGELWYPSRHLLFELAANRETWHMAKTISKSFWHSGLFDTVQYYELKNNYTLKFEGSFSVLLLPLLLRASADVMYSITCPALGFDFVGIAFDQDHGREQVTLCPPKEVWNVGVKLSVPTTSLMA